MKERKNMIDIRERLFIWFVLQLNCRFNTLMKWWNNICSFFASGTYIQIQRIERQPHFCHNEEKKKHQKLKIKSILANRYHPIKNKYKFRINLEMNNINLNLTQTMKMVYANFVTCFLVFFFYVAFHLLCFWVEAFIFEFGFPYFLFGLLQWHQQQHRKNIFKQQLKQKINLYNFMFKILFGMYFVKLHTHTHRYKVKHTQTDASFTV